MIALVVEDVGYLPKPNRIEITLSDEVCPTDLCRTAFLLPVFEDGSIMLAQNRRRGIETPGGHIEIDETPEEAAIREALEEAGCEVEDVRPVGYLKMISEAEEAPEGYDYPFPVSYQQFFAGRVIDEGPVEDEDCREPIRVTDLDGLRPSIQIFGERARELFSAG